MNLFKDVRRFLVVKMRAVGKEDNIMEKIKEFLPFLIPLVSILLACLGFSRARMGAGSSKAGLAKAGKILCIIGIIAAIVMWGLNILTLSASFARFY